MSISRMSAASSSTVLAQMNPFGRVALCGLISAYNATELPPAPKNLRFVLTMRLRVQGFIVFDFARQYKEATAALPAGIATAS